MGVTGANSSTFWLGLVFSIAVPQWPANCAFGGVDQKTLFITARNAAGAKAGALYRIDDMPIAGVAGQP